MKLTLLFSFFFFSWVSSSAQILKKIGDKVKRDSEWRLRSKADQQVNKGLDSIIAIPKKANDKKKAEKNADKTTSTNTESKDNNTTAVNNTTSAKTKAAANENDMTPVDGFITLTLSTDKAYTGFGAKIGIRISGESIKYKNYTQVQIVIKGPSTNDVKQVQLGTDGKFFMDWNPSDETGDFTVTVTSSDKKTTKSEKFSVESFDLPDYVQWPKDNIKETKEALGNLEDAVDLAEDGLSPKDKAEMDEKMNEIKEKVDELFQLFKDIGNANKELMQMAKKEKKLPSEIAGYLAEINRALAEQASQLKKINETVHKPQDNTICEHLVMVNEACAALSTFTAPVARVVKTGLANIASYITDTKPIDKENTTDKYYTFYPGKILSIYLIAKRDADGLSTKLNKIGFTADLAQLAGDVLLKKYCGIIKGEIKHDYTINFRNANGVSWWKYGADMQGAIVLRYPKEGSKGKIIKMKGCIEGNATKFTFYQNTEANDDFHDGTKGKIEAVELRVIKPATVPFVSSLNDPGGFGAVARGLTPASFYITIDAEYDVDANKIKIFFNTALMDFTDAVNNQLIFLEVGPDMFPYIKKMTFPISKVFTTMGSIVRSNSEFNVSKDAKGNISFAGKANKHLGTKNDKIEHDLNFSVFAKKE